MSSDPLKIDPETFIRSISGFAYEFANDAAHHTSDGENKEQYAQASETNIQINDAANAEIGE